MALVNQVPVRREVPGEDAWIEFRALSAKQLRKAARTRQLEAAELLKAYGGDLLRAMQGVDRGEVAQAAADPLNDYHFEVLLSESIVGWSYDVPVRDGIGQLDAETETWALGVIAEISGITRETEQAKAIAS